jgi:hypothetical protein
MLHLRVSFILIVGLALFALPACRPVVYYSPPAFIGSFDGYLKPAEGPAVGLSVTTSLIGKEALRYTFAGEAVLGGEPYRVEGEETSNGVITYQATPPVNQLSATFYDDAGAARYHLFMYVLYGRDLFDMTFEGSLHEVDDGPYLGSVHLQRSR